MELYADNLRRLREAGVENAAGELCELIAFCVGEPYESVRRTVMLSSSGCSYVCDNVSVCEKLAQCVDKRLAGKPLQYITGRTDFYGYTFLTAENVLIPRFDTECVLEAAIGALKEKEKPSLCDICCGSGCIGITAALQTCCRVTCVDISDDALALTAKNAEKHGVKAQIVKKDILHEILDGIYDVIVSNPPYIPTDDLATLSVEVRNEPTLALDGGKDGLVFYRRIARDCRRNLVNGGTLVFEIGVGQRDDIEKILSENGYSEIRFIPDFGGVDRAAVCKKRD